MLELFYDFIRQFSRINAFLMIFQIDSEHDSSTSMNTVCIHRVHFSIDGVGVHFEYWRELKNVPPF